MVGDYGIDVPMNVRCEGTIVLYHRNFIRGDTVGVFHNVLSIKRKKSNIIDEVIEIEDLWSNSEGIKYQIMRVDVVDIVKF